MAQRIICLNGATWGNNLGTVNRSFLFLALSCTLNACSPVASNSLTKTETDATIVNGKTVDANELISRSVVGVLVSNPNNGSLEMCSGTLLKNNLVLTAAHCVDPREGNLDISIIFDLDINDAGGPASSEARKVTRTAIPAWWGAPDHLETDTGDIALLQYGGKTPQGYIPVTALASEDDLANSSQLLIAGYGANQVTKTPINVDTYPDLIAAIQIGQVTCEDPVRLLNCSEMKVTGTGTLREATSAIRNNRYSSSEMEVIPKSGVTCHGDSGGPAFIVKNNLLYLAGVANRSSNNKVTDCSTSSIYANVPFFHQWLNVAASQLKTQNK